MDYYLNYFKVHSLKDKAATKVNQVLKRQFARNGIPNRLVNDNGPLSNPLSSRILQKVMMVRCEELYSKLVESTARKEKATEDLTEPNAIAQRIDDVTNLGTLP